MTVSKFANLARTNVIVESVDTADGFEVKAFVRNPNGDDLVSETFTHSYTGEVSPVEIALMQRGARDYVKGGITGATETASILEKANNKIAELAEGNIVERTVGNGSTSSVSFLLRAVMEVYPEVTPTIWKEMSEAERAEKAADLRVIDRKDDLAYEARKAKRNS